MISFNFRCISLLYSNDFFVAGCIFFSLVFLSFSISIRVVMWVSISSAVLYFSATSISMFAARFVYRTHIHSYIAKVATTTKNTSARRNLSQFHCTYTYIYSYLHSVTQHTPKVNNRELQENEKERKKENEIESKMKEEEKKLYTHTHQVNSWRL